MELYEMFSSCDNSTDCAVIPSPTVEPLVVNCDESDSETCSSTVPDTNSKVVRRIKTQRRKKIDNNFNFGVKTLEELKQEKEMEKSDFMFHEGENMETDLRLRIKKRVNSRILDDNELDFKIKTLDEIREERKLQENTKIESVQNDPENVQKQRRRPLKRLPTEFYKSRVSDEANKLPNDANSVSEGLKRKIDNEPVQRKKLRVKKDVNEDCVTSYENKVPDEDEDLDILLGDDEFEPGMDVKEEDLLLQLDEMINN